MGDSTFGEPPRGRRVAMNESVPEKEEESVDECLQELNVTSTVLPLVVGGLALAVFIALVVLMVVSL